MRAINKKNIVIFCVLTLIFIIFVFVVIWGLNKEGNYNTVIEINGVDDKNENAYSDEIWITAIYMDNTLFSLQELELPEGWAEKNGMIYANGGNNANSLIIKGNVEKIQFLRHAWCGIVEIKVNGDVHGFDLYSEDVTTFEFNVTDFLQKETIYLTIVAFVLFFVFYLFFGILFYNRKMYEKKAVVILYYILYMVNTYIFLFTTDRIKNTTAVQVLVVLLAISTLLVDYTGWNKMLLKKYMAEGRAVVLYIAIVGTLVSTAMFVCKLFFIGDESLGFDISGILYLNSGMVWVIPILYVIIIGIKFLTSREFKIKKAYVCISKTVIFVVIFCVILYNVQGVLRHKWGNDENLSTRFKQYENLENDSVDILFLGTSSIYASMYPIVMYEEYGITGYNLGISMQTAMTEYYMLEYALEQHSPKIVVLGLCGLIGSRKADSEIWEPTYRKVVDTIPDAKIKFCLVKDIVNSNESQDYASYYLPILRYHSRWMELEQLDFDDTLIGKWYTECSYGALMHTDFIEINESDILYEDGSQISIYSEGDYYLKKIVELCNEKNIKCVAVNPPGFGGGWSEERRILNNKWCEEQGIPYIDYNTDELLHEIELELSKDFYNAGHLNLYGGRKVTINLGAKLIEWYGLESHDEPQIVNEWNEKLAEYHEKYDSNLNQ